MARCVSSWDKIVHSYKPHTCGPLLALPRTWSAVSVLGMTPSSSQAEPMSQAPMLGVGRLAQQDCYVLAAVSMDHRSRHRERPGSNQTMPIAWWSAGVTISLLLEPQAPVLDNVLIHGWSAGTS